MSTFSMMLMWSAVVGVVVQTCSAALHPTSPCPSVFTYEGDQPERERWYGIVLLNTDESLVGVRIDVKLDRPAEILVSWMGTVTTDDNVLFTILSLDQKLHPGPPLQSRFMVKFNAIKGSPQVRTIRLNGKQICPPDPNYPTDTQSSGQDHLYDNKYTTERITRRPDLDFDDDWTNPRPVNPPRQNNNKPPVRQNPSGYESHEREPEYNNHGSGTSGNTGYSDSHSGGYNNKGNVRTTTYSYDSHESYDTHRKPSSGYTNSSRPLGTSEIDLPLVSHTNAPRPSINININKDVTLNVDRPDALSYSPETSEINRPINSKDTSHTSNQYPKHTEKHHEQSNPGSREDMYTRTTTTTKKPIVINSININIHSVDGDITSEVSSYKPSTYKPPTNRPYNNKNNTVTQRPVNSGGQRPDSNHQHNRPIKNTDMSSSETHYSSGYGQNSYEGTTEKIYHGNQGSSKDQPNRRPSSTDYTDTGRPNPTSRPGGGDGIKRTQRPQTSGQKNGGSGNSEASNVKCGSVVVNPSPAPLITHGQNTARGQWPWHVALYRVEGINLSYSCGGSLVSSTVVITAAHCVTKAPRDRPIDADILLVQLGKYHLYQFSDDSVQNKQVQNVYVHPSYNSTNYLDDLAVLTLSTAAEFTKYVRPVCLWPKHNFNLPSIDNKEGTVVGWGYDENNQVTEELKMARMPVVSYVTCLKSYPQFFSQFTAENKTFCAGFRQGTSVCNGDSGGGMVFQHNNAWYLRGLVSITVAKQGLRVCDTNHFVVFTDVANYVDWINQYLS